MRFISSSSALLVFDHLVGAPKAHRLALAWMLAMTLQIEPRHDLSLDDIDAIEERLYEHNSHATGRHDGRGLGFVIRDDAGQMVGVAAGYTWAGTSELKQMWIDEAYRGRGYGRALLNAFVTEAR